ncbi:MAG: hypothetical protein JW956_06655, partial [Calditrichaceae bacterium]|nr:hypothetical protein [Calditrichaceae bacterium]
MKISITILLLFSFFVLPVCVLAQQNLLNTGQNDDIMQELIKSQLEQEFKKRESQSSSLLSKPELLTSINADEYIVDAGDEFTIKINVKGPDYKVYSLTTTPIGYIVIPDGPSIYVKYKKVKDAQLKIIQAVDNWFPNANIEAHLSRIHPIEVNVIGSVPKQGKLSLISNYRLFDAFIESLSKSEDQDEYKLFSEKLSSFRNVKLIRQNRSIEYDLFKFKYRGELDQNPYV